MKLTLGNFIILNVLLGGALLLSPPAHGAKYAKAPDTDYKAYNELGLPEMKTLTDEEFAKEEKESLKRAKRSIAQVANDSFDAGRNLSPTYRNLVNEILGLQKIDSGGNDLAEKWPGIKTPEAIDAFITKLESNYSSYPSDAKFLAAQLIPMKVFKSLAYRMRPMVDKKDRSRAFPHALLVTFIRQFVTGMAIYAHTGQWKALLQYLTEPFPGTENKLMNREQDFYVFLRDELLGTLHTYRQRIEDLNFKSTPIYWDNHVFYTPANFKDSLDQYVRIGEAERRSLVSAIYGAISATDTLCAYSLENLFVMIQDVAKVYGFQTAYSPGSATAQTRFNVMKKYQDTLFVLRPEEKKIKGSTNSYMYKALEALQISVEQGYLSWDELGKDPSNQPRSLFNPAAFMPFNRTIASNFGVMRNIVKGPFSVQSDVVNGEHFDVNVPALFMDPPERILADFLPTAFEHEGGDDMLPKKIGNKPYFYRDYFRGRPIGWNWGNFHKYLPGVNSDADLTKGAQILSQAWGGWLVGLPLAGFIN